MRPIVLIATGAVLTLTVVLVLAAVAKLRAGTSSEGLLVGLPIRATRRTVHTVAAAELTVAALALLLPARIGGLLLAGVFGCFTVAHIRARQFGSSDCGCFGEEHDVQASNRGRTVLTAGSALLMAPVAVVAPAAPVSVAASDPWALLAVMAAAVLAGVSWRRVFTAAPVALALPRRVAHAECSPFTAATLGERVVTSSALFLERRFSRRTALTRLALAGSALAVAPLRYLLYPVSALAAIGPGDCSGGLCLDGYTVFCCEITGGVNTCPAGTFPGGWWMCTSYGGGQLCAPEGVRYYVDCNRIPWESWPGGCTCGNNSCANRREACNVFRYGQCNTQIGGVTEVVCRMVVCENPGSIRGLNCSYSVAVDDAVCGQDVPCLEPPAIQLAGAGGV